MYDPRTITHVDAKAKMYVMDLAENYKFERDGLHTLIYEYERDEHNEDEYLGTLCLTVILNRRFDGYYLTFKKSYETYCGCSYEYYIHEEKLDLIPYERDILKEAFKGNPMEEF